LILKCLVLAFYDPDGYYFNVEGFDEFGGYYDDHVIFIFFDFK
jgi:hypothetical protein